jgi:hypothetical protein
MFFFGKRLLVKHFENQKSTLFLQYNPVITQQHNSVIIRQHNPVIVHFFGLNSQLMATPNEKLAESLEILKEFHEKGKVAIKSTELSRVHRERLLKNGYLKKVTKGWYIAIPSNEQPGDSTSWYSSYWHFCAEYLADRYGKDYFISPEQSLQIHTGNWKVPQQLIIRSTKKSVNHKTPLPYGTSLFHWDSPVPKAGEIITVEGIRMYSLPSALIYSTPSMFKKDPLDARTALAMIKDASDITKQLLEGGHSTIAGRLAGTFRNIGRDRIADDIIKTMQSAGYDIRETDPFETPSTINLSPGNISPYVNRVRLMWNQMRDVIIELFPKAPGLPDDHEKYMKEVEEIYVTDAYHSLSIERYRVTPELIERVRSGTWDINNSEDKKQRDAMAARGYWQATQKVRESILKVLNGKNAGAVTDEDHGDWYRELFGPSVVAGLLKASDLAGYRNHQVYISGSMHVPVNADGVRDVMPELFELLKHEGEASVRAVLGHFIFVFIHPYMDGNGRMGRFLMNVMLASGGYPWTVIPIEERKRYMEALEKASTENDIKPFAEFIAYLVNESLKGKPIAKI